MHLVIEVPQPQSTLRGPSQKRRNGLAQCLLQGFGNLPPESYLAAHMIAVERGGNLRAVVLGQLPRHLPAVAGEPLLQHGVEAVFPVGRGPAGAGVNGA